MHISSTAQMTAVWRSMDEKLSGDYLAKYFVDREGIQLGKYFASLAPLSVRHLSIRNKYIEDATKEFVKSGIKQVCYFASGLITSPYRLDELNNCTVFELDLREVINYKEEKVIDLKKRNIINKNRNVQYLSIDINNTESLIKLLSSNLSTNKSSLFVIEGVSYYLSKKTIADLISSLKKLCRCSAFIMDYWPNDCRSNKIFKMMEENFPGLSTQILSYYTTLEIKKLFSGCEIIDRSLSQIEKDYCKDQLITADAVVINANIAVAK